MYPPKGPDVRNEYLKNKKNTSFVLGDTTLFQGVASGRQWLQVSPNIDLLYS